MSADAGWKPVSARCAVLDAPSAGEVSVRRGRGTEDRDRAVGCGLWICEAAACGAGAATLGVNDVAASWGFDSGGGDAARTPATAHDTSGRTVISRRTVGVGPTSGAAGIAVRVPAMPTGVRSRSARRRRFPPGCGAGTPESASGSYRARTTGIRGRCSIRSCGKY